MKRTEEQRKVKCTREEGENRQQERGVLLNQQYHDSSRHSFLSPPWTLAQPLSPCVSTEGLYIVINSVYVLPCIASASVGLFQREDDAARPLCGWFSFWSADIAAVLFVRDYLWHMNYANKAKTAARAHWTVVVQHGGYIFLWFASHYSRRLVKWVTVQRWHAHTSQPSHQTANAPFVPPRWHCDWCAAFQTSLMAPLIGVFLTCRWSRRLLCASRVWQHRQHVWGEILRIAPGHGHSHSVCFTEGEESAARSCSSHKFPTQTSYRLQGRLCQLVMKWNRRQHSSSKRNKVMA